MLPFKRRISSLILLVLVQALAACTLPKPEPRDNSNLDVGTFLVDKSEISVNEATQHQEISLALAKTFNFKVCLKDQKFLKPIYDHHFEVTGGEEEAARDLTSDANGCVNWIEKISYNHLAPAKWVEVIRKIKAVGFHQGQRQAHFAVNPWEDRGISLLNNKVDQLVTADKGAKALKAEAEPNIWLDDMRLTITEKTPGRLLGIQIRGQVSFPITKADGNKILEPITRGQFLAEFTLINIVTKDQKEIHTFIGKTEPTEAKVSGNILMLDKEALMALSPQSMCSYGQIVLGVRLIPQVKDLKLNPFEGIFANIGECDQLKGTFFSRLQIPLSTQTDGPRSIQDYLKSTTLLTLPSNTDTESSRIAGMPNTSSAGGTIPTVQNSVIIKQPMEFKDMGYLGTDSYSREKAFSITACMLAPIDHKPLRGQVFNIVKINGTNKTSDPSSESGCITWNDSVPFHFLDKEGWIRKSFKIQNELLKIDETVFIDVNPWKKGNGCVLDSRYEKPLPSADGLSKIVLNNFDFDMRDERYPVDQMLDLKARKIGIMRITAHLLRPSGQATIGADDNDVAPPGKYRLRWAIVDGSVTDFNHAAGLIYQVDEKIVTLETGGTISETLALETGNLKSLGNFNHILFELETLQDNSNLKRETYRGAVVLADRKTHENLEALGQNQESLISKLSAQFKADQLAHEKQRAEASTKEHYAAQNNLFLINLNELSGAKSIEPLFQASAKLRAGIPAKKFLHQMQTPSATELLTWLNEGKVSQALMDRLCYHWFFELLLPYNSADNEAFDEYNRCAQSTRDHAQNFIYPQATLSIEYPFFLKKISQITDKPRAEFSVQTVQDSFSLSYADDKTFTRSVDVNFGLNTGKLLSPLSFGGGGRLQWAWSTKEGSSNSVTVQKSLPMVIEKLHMPLRADAYEKCAVVRLNPRELPLWMEARMDPDAWHPFWKEPLPENIRRAKAQEARQAMKLGYMICPGQVRNQSITFEETYALLNQTIQNTQVINPNSAEARSLFIAVRGERDFQKVLQLVSGSIKMPTASDSMFQSRQDPHRELLSIFSDSALTAPGEFTSNR